jgi:hypothetical protein
MTELTFPDVSQAYGDDCHVATVTTHVTEDYEFERYVTITNRATFEETIHYLEIIKDDFGTIHKVVVDDSEKRLKQRHLKRICDICKVNNIIFIKSQSIYSIV